MEIEGLERSVRGDPSTEPARARRSNLPAPAESPNPWVKRVDHRSDVTVLENRAFALLCSPDRNIHHRPGQVVGPNHLVGEERPKRGVDRAQEAVAEIWVLPRLHRGDVRRPEDAKAREPPPRQ